MGGAHEIQLQMDAGKLGDCRRLVPEPRRDGMGRLAGRNAALRLLVRLVEYRQIRVANRCRTGPYPDSGRFLPYQASQGQYPV